MNEQRLKVSVRQTIAMMNVARTALVAKSISEVPLDVLNRLAAEKLGISAEGPCMFRGGCLDPLCVEAADSRYVHLVDLTQPAGMKMLLERMAQTYRIQLSQWSSGPKMHVCCLGTSDGNFFKTQYYATHFDLGHAVLKAFCLSEGFQVEGA